MYGQLPEDMEKLNDELHYAFWSIGQNYGENASKFIETNESLPHNGQRTFRTFILKKKIFQNN